MRHFLTTFILSLALIPASTIATSAKSRECSDHERLAFYDDVLLNAWAFEGQIMVNQGDVMWDTQIYIEDTGEHRIMFHDRACTSTYCLFSRGVKGDETSILAFVNYYLSPGVKDLLSNRDSQEGSSYIFITDNDFCTFQNNIDEENSQLVKMTTLETLVQALRSSVKDNYETYKSGNYKKFKNFSK